MTWHSLDLQVFKLPRDVRIRRFHLRSYCHLNRTVPATHQQMHTPTVSKLPRLIARFLPLVPYFTFCQPSRIEMSWPIFSLSLSAALRLHHYVPFQSRNKVPRFLRKLSVMRSRQKWLQNPDFQSDVSPVGAKAHYFARRYVRRFSSCKFQY